MPSIARRITPISRATNAVNAALIGPNDYKKKGGKDGVMRDDHDEQTKEDVGTSPQPTPPPQTLTPPPT